MFGLEILLALILKFWTILYGLLYGAISSLPMLHRSLLARQLKVEWHEAEYLIVQSPDRDLHIGDLTVKSARLSTTPGRDQLRDVPCRRPPPPAKLTPGSSGSPRASASCRRRPRRP